MPVPPETDPDCPGCAALSERLEALEREMAELASKQAKVIERQAAEIERLKGRKPKTSRTSSKPPSSDNPWKRDRPSRKKSGKKRGGQRGHKGARREPAPPEDVDETKSIRPTECRSCSGALSGDDPNPLRHQIVDIPPIEPHIVEYILHRLTCATCGESTRASLPDDTHASNFGPNLSTLIVLLTGHHGMSRAGAQAFIAEHYGIDISIGAISNIERRMTEGLAGAHEEAIASIAESSVKHLDETTWRESGDLAWVWAAVGDRATAFVIRDSRASVVAKELIGEEPSGILVSDRFSGYSFVDVEQRQVCLAHLIRDFRAMAEGETELRWIGERLLELMNALFRIWHLHKGDEIDRQTLKRWSRPIRERTIRLLDEGARSRGYETPGRCRGILRTEAAMWTFVHQEGIEPTNNVAERAIRPIVIQRKTSLGSQSSRGSDFIARMQTVVATAKRQGRNLLGFIGGITRSILSDETAPKLLG